MRRCEHACGCEGNAAGRDPDTLRYLCAACMGRAILGTDCTSARKYFGHVPVRFAEPGWQDPRPLRDGDRDPLARDFLRLRTAIHPPAWDALPMRTDPGTPAWDFLPLNAATNPNKPPKDPPSGPLPPPPPRPVQPGMPKPKRGH